MSGDAVEHIIEEEETKREDTKTKKKQDVAKIWQIIAIVFIVLFLAAAGACLYLYISFSTYKAPIVLGYQNLEHSNTSNEELRNKNIELIAEYDKLSKELKSCKSKLDNINKQVEEMGDLDPHNVIPINE